MRDRSKNRPARPPYPPSVSNASESVIKLLLIFTIIFIILSIIWNGLSNSLESAKLRAWPGMTWPAAALPRASPPPPKKPSARRFQIIMRDLNTFMNESNFEQDLRIKLREYFKYKSDQARRPDMHGPSHSRGSCQRPCSAAAGILPRCPAGYFGLFEGILRGNPHYSGISVGSSGDVPFRCPPRGICRTDRGISRTALGISRKDLPGTSPSWDLPNLAPADPVRLGHAARPRRRLTSPPAFRHP